MTGSDSRTATTTATATATATTTTTTTTTAKATATTTAARQQLHNGRGKHLGKDGGQEDGCGQAPGWTVGKSDGSEATRDGWWDTETDRVMEGYSALHHCIFAAAVWWQSFPAGVRRGPKIPPSTRYR